MDNKDYIARLEYLLDERSELLRKTEAIVYSQNKEIQRLRQRERDLLDVIHESQVRVLRKVKWDE